MAYRFTTTVPIDFVWNGQDFVGVAGTVFSVADEEYAEFVDQVVPQIAGTVTWGTHTFPTTVNLPTTPAANGEIWSSNGILTNKAALPFPPYTAPNVVLNPAATATAFPAGGTGDPAGAWDTAQHRNDAIAAFAAALVDLAALRTTVNATLTALRKGYHLTWLATKAVFTDQPATTGSPSQKTIASNTLASPSVCTVSAGHGLTTGQTIFIASSNSDPVIDGARVVTVLTPTTFSVPVAVTTAGTAGTFYAPFALGPTVIAIQDDLGNTITTDNTTVVTVALAATENVVMEGTKVVTAVAGVCSFPNLTVNGLISGKAITGVAVTTPVVTVADATSSAITLS